MNKALVSYFSATGNTKAVAEKIAASLHGDLFEIEPVTKYTNDDLDWTNESSRSSIEMMNNSSRPDIVQKVANIEEYDTVYIGFPVWWDVAPRIINTFIEENDLTGKKIYVFVTSGSSSEVSSFNNLKETYPNLNFVSAKRFIGNERDDDYKSCIEK